MNSFKLTTLSLAALTAISFSACGGGGSSSTTTTPTIASIVLNDLNATDLSGVITTNTTLTADTIWRLNGLVVVDNNATLTIQPGTTIIGAAGTGAATSYLVINKNAKIDANATLEKPIVFMSEEAYRGGVDTWGQWGGVTIIGNAAMDAQVQPYEVDPQFVAGTGVATDSSGILRNVKILNSGITMEVNKEVNGLSLVGVGSGTVIENLTVNKSDDDCVEIWGGTVNLTNVDVSECTDDQFDIDDGYSGTVTNLKIHQTTGNSGIEMSGTTAATFNNFDIYVAPSAAATAKEGAIFFKKDGIGGHFNNGTIMYDLPSTNTYGAIHSSVGFTADSNNTSFTNVTLTGSNPDKFTGDSATALKSVFTADATNILN
ncbi:hypothetical protein [Sulfurimonas sp.]